MADPFNPVNVGGTILRRFNVTFDYRNQSMYLAKNADFGAPFSYDRSGLFLIDVNGAYTVLSVLPGSPGAAAGLAKGDVLLNVNATPAANDSLAALRQLLSGAVGTVVHLHVRTAGGAQRDDTLTLADYV
jgi:C-terminal processing protease CtpA/Prc